MLFEIKLVQSFSWTPGSDKGHLAGQFEGDLECQTEQLQILNLVRLVVRACTVRTFTHQQVNKYQWITRIRLVM